MTFLLSEINALNLTSTDCICATSPRCQSAVAIYQSNIDYTPQKSIWSIAYVVPGAKRGCSATESLRLSTLECLYSSSACYTQLFKYIEDVYLFNAEFPIPFNFRPLVYNSTSSRFSPQMPVSMLVDNLFIERWDLSWSYGQFYDSCAPSACLYAVQQRTETFFGVMLTLTSVIGGVTFALRLITPQMIKLIFRLLSKRNQMAQLQGNRVIPENSSNTLSLSRCSACESVRSGEGKRFESDHAYRWHPG